MKPRTGHTSGLAISNRYILHPDPLGVAFSPDRDLPPNVHRSGVVFPTDAGMDFAGIESEESSANMMK